MAILGQGFSFGGFTYGTSTAPSGSPAAWYKADAITGLSDTDDLINWIDSSGNGKTLILGTAPSYHTGVQNSLPIVRFDVINSEWLGVPELAVDWSDGITVFVVYKNNAVATDQRYFEYNSETYNIFIQIRNTATDAMEWKIADNEGGDDVAISNLTSAGQSAFHYWSMKSKPGSLHVGYKDGIAFANTETLVSYRGLSGDVGRMGSSRSGLQPSDIDIGEFIVYNTYLSTAEQQSTEAYLKDKWGL